ncbi:DNA polymerase III subunit delta [Enterococcus sp. BWB1-3]|uniref:DNA polymerase III subunit delta n=1 Tax=unclassified Enterococcus TaxID=2608891 RepID=UPI001920FAD4|nr:MULTISPECIES: DNA polymerase III subunit delta [unclassified Enterococcus]MBL1229543.1 DNA polymerase III subunit delta [Enterococcus sp. BWB1-3]MCB5950766.1 DNA polymerase III subunit delta [Enterococcus sp. BWT-B8]MCB5955207.1 DNA polymerase III subunit delta [Enterococcus sp. CWB-B31]
MSLQTVLKDVRESKIAPLYLVLGTETYLSELFKLELQNHLFQSGEEEFNITSYDMEEISLSAALAEADTLPFFGDHRLVFIENPYFLTSEKKAAPVEHDMKELTAYLEQPSSSTVVVFQAHVEKLDERKKITKLLKKQAVVVDVSPMDERALKEYTQQTIKNEGYEIQPKAFDKLLYLSDFQLTKIMGELQKLFLFSSEDKRITLEIVEELVPKSLEHNVFDLTAEILAGNSEKAIQTYQDLLLQGEETIKLTAILLSQIRLLLQTKILSQLGYQQSNIAEALKVHPYRIKLGLQQSRSFKLQRLEKIYDELVENDFSVKTGRMDKELQFELFILKISDKVL